MIKKILVMLLGVVAAFGSSAADRSVQSSCSFCDLRYSDFSQSRVEGGMYSGAYMFGANFSWAVMKAVNFESATLTLAKMGWADFENANFKKATLENADLSRSILRNADFSMAHLSKVDLGRSDLTGANFSTASMREANLADARLNGATLINANLVGADLAGARLRDANLQGAVLTRADLKGADLGSANFSGAVMNSANMANIEIRLTNFRAASLQGANFRNAVLDAVNFQDADLTGADFTGASIYNTMLNGANLCKAIMPNGVPRDCSAGASPEDERKAMTAVSSNTKVRISLAGNAFANFQQGRPSGLFAEVASMVMSDMGLQSGFISMPADAALKALEEKRLDVATVILKTPRIAEKFRFSDPVLTDYQVVVVRRGKGFALKSVADLRGKRIGLRKGYRYDLLNDEAPFSRQAYNSDGEMIRDLLQGELDAILLSGISDVFALRSEGIMSQLEILGASVGKIPMMLAFSKSRFSEEDVKKFNQYLSQMVASGSWREIMERNGMGDLIEALPSIKP